MRPSSSPSEAAAGLFDGVFAKGDVARLVGATGWLTAMLEVEAALARALARAGLATAEGAAAVTRAARADDFDVASLARAAAKTGNPVVALVEALSAAVPEGARDAVHRGATSQDILDTAMMLLARRAGAVVLHDLAVASDVAAALALRHRGTLMVGRTLLQQALPITFGLKAAGWLTAIDAAGARLREAVDAALYVQLGGAAGTLASLGDRGIEVAALLAEELGLRMPVMPWHAQRLVLFEVATPFAGAAMVVGKIARDVTLLAQSEVREASEARAPGWGASSTMPHKHNPVSAVAALGCARRVPNLLATLATSGEQEHERAAGAWHAEWETFADLLRLTGSAAAWTRDLLGGLTIDEGRMRTTLDDAGPMLAAEHLAALLAPVLGRLPALEHVRDAVAVAERTARPLVGVVLEHAPTASALSEMGLDAGALARALDPARHLGSADAWITRALSAHEASRARSGRAP